MTIKDKLKQTFLDLIKINEVYPHENEVIKYVEQRLDQSKVNWQEDNFKNIVAKVSGTGEPVMLSTHFDIPEPAPKVRYDIDGDIIKADGTNILGADPKSGLAILVEFLCELARRRGKNHVPVEALITRGEEVGLVGASKADYSPIESKIGLVLDEDGPVTQVVTQAPAFVRFDAKFIGKIAHPRKPENGINALQVMCEVLNSIPWGYCNEGVTWNVGKVRAGTAVNSIPGEAVLNAELRSFETDKAVAEAEQITKRFNEIARKYGAKCEVSKELEFEGYKLERDHALFVRLEQAFDKMGLKPNYFATFGGSDANVFNAKGIRCVPIGSGYYNAHQYTEYVNLRDMEEIFNFLLKFVSEGI